MLTVVSLNVIFGGRGGGRERGKGEGEGGRERGRGKGEGGREKGEGEGEGENNEGAVVIGFTLPSSLFPPPQVVFFT